MDIIHLLYFYVIPLVKVVLVMYTICITEKLVFMFSSYNSAHTVCVVHFKHTVFDNQSKMGVK